MISVESKLPRTGTTIFTVMSGLAQQYGAINLGQGFPDFPMPQPLIDAVCRAMNDGFNQYAHTNGLPLLRQRISELTAYEYNVAVDPETEITITPGATYAIYTALTSVLQAGDEVILFEPAYDSYVPNILLNGAKPVFIPLQYPGYGINWQRVKDSITERTRVIVINSPHNPTGTLLNDEDMKQLSDMVSDTNIVVLSDEVYAQLVFDEKKHRSVLQYLPLRQRSFACYSFGKTYHCTGWKMGYCVAPAHLMKEFRKVHQFNAFSTNAPAQAGLAEVLLQKDWQLQLSREMQQKRDLLLHLTQHLPLRPLPSSGSYFQCFDYSAYSPEPDTELAERLVKEAGVATIPLSAFYRNGTDNKVLRLCFAKKESTLQEAAQRLGWLNQ